MVIVPPAPVTVIHVPSGADAMVLLIDSGITVLLAALKVAEIDATTPLPIGVLLPLATHVTEPLAALHVRVLPAALRAVPAEVDNVRTSVGAYESVHCKLDGALPVEFNVRFSVIDPPGIDKPDPNVREL